ncbi:MAG: hypothetical protein KBT12_04105 [Bacteroidales bacterium]|nr:hypothetical protein [Candidatus Physcousia equi]
MKKVLLQKPKSSAAETKSFRCRNRKFLEQKLAVSRAEKIGVRSKKKSALRSRLKINAKRKGVGGAAEEEEKCQNEA